MNETKKKVKALGLCSGGLDSILAGLVLREQAIEVVWVAFETPFFTAEKARKASEMTGIPLIAKDITDRYLPMLEDPPAGFGQHMNPCMDCHALMFRIAGEMMGEIGADFLFSGEVIGQRPMSQTRTSLRYVEKHSGFDGRILRPLSARNLPVTQMEESGLVDRERLCSLSGRSRKPQIEMAKAFGVTDYPAPAGGCLLTDVNISKRLKDLFEHKASPDRAELELLKYGRHIRLSPAVKIVVGRDKADNEQILGHYRPDQDMLIKMNSVPGPVVLISSGSSNGFHEQAAAICAGYSRVPEDSVSKVDIFDASGNSMVEVMPVSPREIQHLLIP